MPTFALTYSPPASKGQRGVLTIADNNKDGTPVTLISSAVVQVDEGVVTQRLDFDPDDIPELMEAVWFIVRFILAIVRPSG